MDNRGLQAHQVGLVPEEMDLREPFVFNVSESVSLIPTMGENVKGQLSTDRVCQGIVGEFLFEDLHESGSYTVFLGAINEHPRGVAIDNTLSYSRKSRRSCWLWLLSRCWFNERCTYDAFLPIGLTLIIPFLNSTNVPL